jgi:hypothetical protein
MFLLCEALALIKELSFSSSVVVDASVVPLSSCEVEHGEPIMSPGTTTIAYVSVRMKKSTCAAAAIV